MWLIGFTYNARLFKSHIARETYDLLDTSEETLMGSLFRLIFGALICALVAPAMTPARAQSNPCNGGGGPGVCIDAFVAVNIWVGTVQLYSSGGTLLSTNSYMTVESSLGLGTDPVSVFLAPLQASSDAAYVRREIRRYLRLFVTTSVLSWGATAWEPRGMA